MLVPLRGTLGPLGLTRAATSYAARVKATATANLIAYWPLWDTSGTTATDESGNGRDGSYAFVSLGADGIGDGRTAAGMNGVSAYVNVYSASLASAFNGSEGTVALWAKVSGAGVWTDGTFREIMRVQYKIPADNLFTIRRTNNNNVMQYIYLSSATKIINYTTTGPLTWMHLVLTWSKSADAVKAYFNGSQVGATQTAIGNWTATAAQANTGGFVLGSFAAGSTPYFPGSIAHVALWTTPLSAAQIAALAVV